MTTDCKKPELKDIESAPTNRNNNDDDNIEIIDNEKIQGGLLSLTDDPETPAFTFRSVTIGCFFALILASANTILSFRTNLIAIPDTVTIIMGYPIGVAMSKLLPRGILNPGDFSIKEHVLVNMIAYCAGKSPYGIDNVIGQRYYLKQSSVTVWSSLAFVLTTQLIGYGLAGMTRRFLVKPAKIIWPYNFGAIALYRVFHGQSDQEEAEKQNEDEPKDIGMSRSTFFWLIFSGIFLYELIPTYFATGIQTLSIVCLFSTSEWASILGSSMSNGGLGVLSLAFDWTLIATGGVLYTPYFAFVNFTVSGILWTWLLPAIIQATNAFQTPFLTNSDDLKFHNGDPYPAINSVLLYNGSGYQIESSVLVDQVTLNLNENVYEQNKPIYLTNLYAISHLGQFMLVASTLCHVFLWYGNTIAGQLKDMLNQRESDDGDVHTEMMRKYWDIPEWMYVVYTVLMLAIQIVILQLTAFKLEWWGTLLAFGIAFVFILPTGVIQALTNQPIGINVLTEFIIGFIIPGKTIDVMSFKSFGIALQNQALDLSSNLKLGYYMHIPPAAMVACQFIGTIIGSITSTFISFWMMDSGLAALQASSSEWNAITYQTFTTAGSIWGSLGPARIFGPATTYFPLLLGFPLGIILPIIPWAANRVYPSKWWKIINVPLLCSNINYIGQNSAIIVTPFIVATIFQYYIYNKHYHWWSKYVYTMGAALDAGTALATVLAGVLIASNISPGSGPLNPDVLDYYCFAPTSASPN